MRRAIIAALAGVALAATMLVAPGPARAATPEESRLVALANGVRASAGVPVLGRDESLSTVARRWATSMAAAGGISHNAALGTQVTGWSKIAENVGMGPDLDTIHRALVASPPHHANLVDPAVTLIGVGVVASGGTLFVVEVFMRPSGSAPAVVPAPAASPSTPITSIRATVPTTTVPTTTVVARRPIATTAPARPAAGAPVTTMPVAADPPSDWLTLVIELTRAWG